MTNRIENFRRKLKPLIYTGNRQTVQIETRLIQEGSTTSFEGSVPEHDILVTGSSLDEMYRRACALLDEKTAITWRPHLSVEMAAGVSKRFKKERRSGECAFGIALHLQVEEFEIGDRAGEKFTRENGRGIKKGLPETGKNLTDWTHYGLKLETLDSYVEDTPQNREALVLLGVEFERLRLKLFDLLNPKTVQKTLTAATARGLLSPAPAEPQKKRRQKKR